MEVFNNYMKSFCDVNNKKVFYDLCLFSSFTEENSSKNGFVNSFILEPTIIWDKKVPNTELDKFKKVIEEKYQKQFSK